MSFIAHPWHGVDSSIGEDGFLQCYIEITPEDTVKFELDKATGLLKVDRPQKYSNFCPCLYGFIPQTYCGDGVGSFCSKKTSRKGILGDGDPLDICVLAEKRISQGNILLQVRPIGGLRIIDNKEADDKIIAVLKEDSPYGHLTDISVCPEGFLERVMHYFLTYKESPENLSSKTQDKIEIVSVYSKKEALQVIELASKDYITKFKDN